MKIKKKEKKQKELDKEKLCVDGSLLDSMILQDPKVYFCFRMIKMLKLNKLI